MIFSVWIPALSIAFTAGWMLFDGARALLVGDYVTAKSGEYAGRLGPWAGLVSAIGIEPRSTLMKSIFVTYGLAGLAAAVCYLLGLPWGRTALIAMAILGLWYLPIGTAVNLIGLILLFIAGR